MNIWDIVLLLAIAAIVGLAVKRVIANRKRGGCGCGGDGCTQRCASRKGGEN